MVMLTSSVSLLSVTWNRDLCGLMLSCGITFGFVGEAAGKLVKRNDQKEFLFHHGLSTQADSYRGPLDEWRSQGRFI